MSKRSFKGCAPGSAEAVIAHAKWCGRRGKNPSMTFGGHRNPKHALKAAMKEVGITAL